MRRILPFAFISIFLLFAACSRDAEVIVKNTGNNPEIVLRHSVPVGHANSVLIQDTLSGTSELRFKIAAKHPAFISLQDVSDPSIIVYFPVQCGETYKLDFDGSAFSFEEPGQDAQRLYAAIPRYGHPQMEALSYTGDTDPVLVRTKLDSARALQMAPFDSLLRTHKISPEMFDLIAADRECNVLSVMAQVGVLLRSEEIQTAAFDGFNPDSDRMLGALGYFDLMEAYASRKLMERRAEIMPLVRAGQINTLLIGEYKKVLTGERLENAYAYQWRFAAIQRRYEKELISLYEEFQKTYPYSPYLSAMQGYYEEICAFHAPKNLSDDIQFMTDTEGISTMDELLSRFVGKKVYIDVWATWCGPCKEEFAHEGALHGLLEDKGYEMLYLSVDKDSDDSQWREMVAYYQLRGYHARAGEALISDLQRLFDANGTMAIPWNMIVDTQGHIVQLHAPRPSDTEALSNALDSVK
ncbi:MAG: TlpA family protein disulfide reductase [Bacteroidales bacterium]|nr:TlpA family protein disulfide reductase [Bacteroidales bacterium]